jgi:hypothetical protein
MWFVYAVTAKRNVDDRHHNNGRRLRRQELTSRCKTTTYTAYMRKLRSAY